MTQSKRDKLRQQHKKNTAPPVIGQVMSDDTLYAGQASDTGTMLFALPQDTKGPKTYEEAEAFIKALNARRAHGHDDWAIPTPGELRTLFAARDTGAFKDTFNTAAKDEKTAWYWSSATDYDDRSWIYACGGRLKGVANYHDEPVNLRCVRRKKELTHDHE